MPAVAADASIQSDDEKGASDHRTSAASMSQLKYRKALVCLSLMICGCFGTGDERQDLTGRNTYMTNIEQAADIVELCALVNGAMGMDPRARNETLAGVGLPAGYRSVLLTYAEKRLQPSCCAEARRAPRPRRTSPSRWHSVDRCRSRRYRRAMWSKAYCASVSAERLDCGQPNMPVYRSLPASRSSRSNSPAGLSSVEIQSHFTTPISADVVSVLLEPEQFRIDVPAALHRADDVPVVTYEKHVVESVLRKRIQVQSSQRSIRNDRCLPFDPVG